MGRHAVDLHRDPRERLLRKRLNIDREMDGSRGESQRRGLVSAAVAPARRSVPSRPKIPPAQSSRMRCPRSPTRPGNRDAFGRDHDGPHLPVPLPERKREIGNDRNDSSSSPVRPDDHGVRRHSQELNTGPEGEPVRHVCRGHHLHVGGGCRVADVEPGRRAEKQARQSPPFATKLQLHGGRH